MNAVIEQSIRQLAKEGRAPLEPALVSACSDFGLLVREEGGELVLDRPLELLDEDRLRGELSDRVSLECHLSIGSTNTHLMNQTAEPHFHGRVCLAEQQVSGKGRRGRRWVSPFGKNIYLSLGWHLKKSVSMEGLSLVVGMQVAQTLRAMGIASLGLKWPNDLLLSQGKMGGILVEVGPPGSTTIPVVIGIGINLRLDQTDAGQIDQPWSAAEAVASLSRNELVVQLLRNLVPELAQFSDSGFRSYQTAWDRFNLYHGTEVKVLLGDSVVIGVDRGVDDRGQLLLEIDGVTRSFNAGEVSLRPLGG